MKYIVTKETQNNFGWDDVEDLYEFTKPHDALACAEELNNAAGIGIDVYHYVRLAK